MSPTTLASVPTVALPAAGSQAKDAEAVRSGYGSSGVQPGGAGGTMLPKVSAEIWVIGK